MSRKTPGGETTGFEIAVIGMAGRYPGARNLEEFWRNLRDGVESISSFSDEQLLASGVEPAMLSNPRYVKKGAVLQDAELFDASFFGITPREAEILDPQHRFFLECAWEALEDAGYDPETYKGPIGFFGGTSRNTYLLLNLLGQDPEAVRGLANVLASDVDYLTTRVSYKLNLRGPSVDVQAACSTSLVAIHLACQNLLAGECDMALAGGVSLTVPQETGYLYQEGGTYAADGHCHAFDARADGMVGANGVGIVVLKRLVDALADGDSIRALIRASAINNDGSAKLGFSAPSVDGQAEVIGRALALAETSPDSIGYVEAHGTGTNLGDPIEIAGLTRAFRVGTSAKRFCAIGSLKTNIGHSNAAAGVGGLIKTVLSLQHGVLAPSLNFERPNPNIDFENSPFYVNTTLRDWPRGKGPRRAGVNSFGMGGTNAHVVLEEAPPLPDPGESRPWQLLVLSAKTAGALDRVTLRLRAHLASQPGIDLANAAYTLQAGRRRFPHRRFLVCRDSADAVATLEAADPKRVISGVEESRERAIVFMFPGQGAQHVNMGRELYESEPTFRQHLDECAEALRPHLSRDLREAVFPGESGGQAAAEELKQTSLAQPALFAIEYALAQLWMSWGVRPDAMIGHSIGEYVAACLSGVFSLRDAVALVAERGRLMQSQPHGSMLAVPLPAREVEALLGDGVDVAALNEEAVTVVSGPTEAVARLESRLAESGVVGQRLHTSHAFHSAMMDPILAPLAELVRRVERRAPRIPYVSNLTGTWITAAQAADPDYWSRHLRQPVRFAAGLKELLKQPNRLLLEVGPGRTLSTLANRESGRAARGAAVTSMRHPSERQPEQAFLMAALGRVWLAGADIDWKGVHSRACRRVPLPTYPFERQRYWIAAQPKGRAPSTRAVASGKNADVADWFYAPSWKRTPLPPADGSMKTSGPWLLFADAALGPLLQRRLKQAGHEVVSVVASDTYAEHSQESYSLNPRDPRDYGRLVEALRARGRSASNVVHLWSLTRSRQDSGGPETPSRLQELGFYSLVYLSRALGERDGEGRCGIVVVSDGIQDVTGREALEPEAATVLGPCKVIPQEYTQLSCRSVDLEPPAAGWDDASAARLAQELIVGSSDHVVAYRGAYRWVQGFEPWAMPAVDPEATLLREDGVYLVTGGLGGIGLEVAEFLARAVRARLVLVGRSPLPGRSNWESWLATHDESDEISRRIRKVQALETLGSEVLVVAADAADLAQMSRVVGEAEARFGPIHGVVHAMGAEKTVQLISEAGPSESEPQFRPRLQGVQVLERVMEGRSLDFCLLISSLSAVLGAVGSVAYTAAHVFLDVFAARHNRTSPVPWLSVNWDRWFTWREAASAPTAGEGDYSMTAEEAQDALGRVLSPGNPAQLVVSTGNLQARIDRWIHLPSSTAPEESSADRRSAYSRPDLVQAYVAPRTPAEKSLAGIWSEALGLEKVGVNDDFFELGGDSVLGLRIVAKANEAGVRLTGRHIFEHHTIAELAAAVAGAGSAPAQQGAVAGSAEPAVAFPAARLNEKQLESVLTKLGDGGTQSK